MPRSEEVDAYIEAAAPFAQPILKKLRDAFHKAEPAIEEAIKWGVPHFVHNGIVGGMAAFKAHVGFGFWKSEEMSDPAGLFERRTQAGISGIRFESTKDLPAQGVLVRYIKEAVALNKTGGKQAPKRASKKPPPKAPAFILKALKQNAAALKVFEAFPPSHKREYIEWITEAKREETRDKRLAQAIEWMAEGKSRNWKYERKAR